MVSAPEFSNNRGREEEEDNRWHLDKRFSVSHLISTVILAASLVSWGSAMDRRIAVLEEKAITHQKDQQRQDDQFAESLKLMREEFKSMRDDIRETGRKLDRYFEGRGRG